MSKYVSEFFGTAFLLVIVVGSGIMGENLAKGNEAIVLLANSLATGAGLFVLIQCLGPISGAHFNPVVSLIEMLWGRLKKKDLIQYWPVTIAAYITGAYWFTSSTSFANPAVTLARSLTNTFCGIAPTSIWTFILAQVLGALAAYFVIRKSTQSHMQ